MKKVNNTYSYDSPVHKNLIEPNLNKQFRSQTIISTDNQIKELNTTNSANKDNVNQIYHSEEDLSHSLYNDLSSFNSQYKNLQKVNQNLRDENCYLKEMLNKKQSIIVQFESVVKESTLKFEQMEIMYNDKKNLLKEKHLKEKNELIKEIEELRNILNEKNLVIESLNKKNFELTNSKNCLLQELNTLHFTNENQNKSYEEQVSQLERENQLLLMQKNKLIEENNNIRQYANTIEETCSDQAQKRKQREIEEQKKEKEYIETIMKLRCVLSEKEKENNELKNRIMNCNSKTNMTYEVSTSYD